MQAMFINGITGIKVDFLVIVVILSFKHSTFRQLLVTSYANLCEIMHLDLKSTLRENITDSVAESCKEVQCLP